MEAKPFFAVGPPLFSCSNLEVWQFIYHFMQQNEKTARLALKVGINAKMDFCDSKIILCCFNFQENKGACLECLKHAMSLIKTFKEDGEIWRSFENSLAKDVGSRLEDFLKLAQ